MASRNVRERTLHTVYICKDRDGRVLYVGVTMYAPEVRLAAHRRKPWWGEVASVETELHPGRSAGIQRELALIHQYEPPYNDQGTEKSRKRAREQWRARKLSSHAQA